MFQGRSLLKEIDFWDVDEMANQIISLLRHDALANQLGSLGKEETDKLSWRDSAKKCLDLYRSFRDHLEE